MATPARDALCPCRGRRIGANRAVDNLGRGESDAVVILPADWNQRSAGHYGGPPRPFASRGHRKALSPGKMPWWISWGDWRHSWRRAPTRSSASLDLEILRSDAAAKEGMSPPLTKASRDRHVA